MEYTYDMRVGKTQMNRMQDASSYIYSGFLSGDAEYFPSGKWMFGTTVNGAFHYADTWDATTRDGYREGRPEVSVLATARYRPCSRVGLAIDLREMFYDDTFAPPIPPPSSMSPSGRVTD